MIYLTVVYVRDRTTNQLIIHNCTEVTSFYLISFLLCLFDFESNQWIRFAFLWKQTWNWISNDSDSSNVKPRPWNQATDFLHHKFSHYQEDLLLLNCEDGIVNLDSGQVTPTNEKVVSQKLSDCQNFAQSYSIPFLPDLFATKSPLRNFTRLQQFWIMCKENITQKTGRRFPQT